MKWLFILISSMPLYAFAQQKPTDPSDTLKITRLKHNKTEESNGFKMGTAYDIWENTSQTPQLSTLTKTIRASGLVATFRSNGPLTLFAPTNSAFTKFPKGRLETLMKRINVLDLSALLTCQAVPGRFDYGDLEDLANDDPAKGRLVTLGGNIILVRKEGENVVLIDEKGNKVNIIAPDLVCHNGYIHVINAVLMPKPKIN